MGFILQAYGGTLRNKHSQAFPHNNLWKKTVRAPRLKASYSTTRSELRSFFLRILTIKTGYKPEKETAMGDWSSGHHQERGFRDVAAEEDRITSGPENRSEAFTGHPDFEVFRVLYRV